MSFSSLPESHISFRNMRWPDPHFLNANFLYEKCGVWLRNICPVKCSNELAGAVVGLSLLHPPSVLMYCSFCLVCSFVFQSLLVSSTNGRLELSFQTLPKRKYDPKWQHREPRGGSRRTVGARLGG